MSSCHDLDCTKGPVYLLGLDTLRLDPKNGIPDILRQLFASSTEAHSTNANFALTRHCTMGDAVGAQSLTRRMAALKNWRRSISDVPGGVFPTKSSRFILSCAACWAARMEFDPPDGPADIDPCLLNGNVNGGAVAFRLGISISISRGVT